MTGRMVPGPAERIDWRVDPHNGWSKVAKGGVVVERLPGTHLTVFDPANSKTIGDALRPYLLSA